MRRPGGQDFQPPPPPAGAPPERPPPLRLIAPPPARPPRPAAPAPAALPRPPPPPRRLPRHQLQERRLARPVHPHDRPALVAPQLQVQPLINHPAAIALVHALERRDVLARTRRRLELERHRLPALGRLDPVDLVELLDP